MSTRSNKLAKNQLISIFEDFTIENKDIFVNRLEKWCKEYENIDLKIFIDPDFDDIVANLDINLKSKKIVELTGIRIGRNLFEKLKRPTLAAGFLIELEVYKKFYKKDLLRYTFYTGITYSKTSLIITTITTILSTIEKVPLVVKYATIVLLLVILIKLLFLTISWIIITNKEYELNKKYGLVKETVDFYHSHERIVTFRSNRLIRNQSDIVRNLTEFFNQNSIFGNK
ncbi:MAG: hypothetical protein ACPLX8_01885, partial [Nanopusillaceae archaeon]